MRTNPSQSKASPARGDTFVRALLAHFDATRRDTPWRRTRDPYAIWVSEVMLQQTRIDAVIPYYERWLDRFPTIDHLADAAEETVLRSWEGLGYYSRARNLHAAARMVRERYAGRVPDTAAELRALPGVGAYTAGAVSSIAYGRVEPAIDGNARRVFARMLDLEDDSIPAIQRIARDIVPQDRPGDFNQAIMELGATICTPRPRCGDCPVQPFCRAFANDTIELRPSKAERKTVPEFDLAVVVMMDADGRILLQQRGSSGLLAGFWEFPSRICSIAQTNRVARALARSVSSVLSRAQRLDPVRHVFSHRIETYHPFVFNLQTTNPVCDVGTWVDQTQLHELPLPVAQRRIAAGAALMSATPKHSP